MHKEIQRFLKFALIGVSNVIVDIGVYKLLLLIDINKYSAASISYTLAMTNSFVWNRMWTFSDGQRNVYYQYFQFMIANAIGYLFNIGLVYLFGRYLVFSNELLNEFAPKLAAIVLIVFWNYGISRLVIFKPNNEIESAKVAQTK